MRLRDVSDIHTQAGPEPQRGLYLHASHNGHSICAAHYDDGSNHRWSATLYQNRAPWKSRHLPASLAEKIWRELFKRVGAR